jgi:superfamily I DNA/RNA helicase
MPGELRPHSLIPSSLQLIVVHLEAGALRDAEALAGMLARTDIPERLSGGHPDRYQALAVRQQISALLRLIQKKDVSNALAVAHAVLVTLEEIEKD